MKKFIDFIKKLFSLFTQIKAVGELRVVRVEEPKIDSQYLGVLAHKIRTYPIDYGIIHCASAWKIDAANRYEVDKVVKIFQDYGVSAHIIIGRDGTIYELVPDNKVAYHAGKSSWEGKSNLNKNTLGVELIGVYDGPYLLDGFTDEQYTSLIWWANKKSVLDWLGHSDISPGRKLDPGFMFDWDRFRKGLVDKDEIS